MVMQHLGGRWNFVSSRAAWLLSEFQDSQRYVERPCHNPTPPKIAVFHIIQQWKIGMNYCKDITECQQICAGIGKRTYVYPNYQEKILFSQPFINTFKMLHILILSYNFIWISVILVFKTNFWICASDARFTHSSSMWGTSGRWGL